MSHAPCHMPGPLAPLTDIRTDFSMSAIPKLLMTTSTRKIACTFCKRRKIKCDKQERCGGCVKYNNPLCVYENPKKRTPKNQVIETELDVLKNKILRLEEALNNTEGGSKVSPKASDILSGPLPAPFPQQVPQVSPGFLFSPGPLPLPGLFHSPGQFPSPGQYLSGQVPLFGLTPQYDPIRQNVMEPGYRYNQLLTQELRPLYQSKTTLTSSASASNSGANSVDDTNSISSEMTSAMVSDLGDKEDFDEKVRYLKKTMPLEPELAQLLAGRLYMFNAHKNLTIDAYERSCDDVLYFGVFSWRAYFKLDPGLFLLWSYLDEKVTNKEIAPFCDRKNNGPKSMSDEVTRAAFANSHLSIGESARDAGKTLGLNVQSNYNSNLSLISKIEMTLPNRKVIWKLIDIYFTTVYPKAPFADLEDFRAEVIKLIGSEVNESQPLIRIAEEIDFANLGILLLVLRFAYLSLFSDNVQENEKAFNSDDPDPEVQERKYLLNHPINVESYFLSQECLNKFNLFKVTDLRVMQLLLYTYIYRTTGPEFGVEPDSNENYNILGLLLLLATSLGLHRDPDLVKGSASPKEKELRRKIWYYVRMVDIFQGYIVGLPLRASFIPSDTKLPDINFAPHSAATSNSSPTSVMVELEKACKLLSPESISTIEQFLMAVMDVNKSYEVSEIMRQHRVLESIYDIIHREVVLDVLDADVDVDYFNMVKYKMFLFAQGSSISIIFHLYCHFDKLGDSELAFYFLSKIFSDFFPSLAEYCSLVDKNNKYLSILIQAAGSIFHKSLLIITGLLVRLKTFLSMNTVSEQDAILYNKFISTLEEYSNNILVYVNKFAERYYYNWFIGKSTEYALKVLDNSIQMSTSRFTTIKAQINMGILSDVLKVSKLHCLLDGVNLELRHSKDMANNQFLSDNVDHLWLYLNSMNRGDNTNNLSLIDAILRDLDNISP